jgi:hypothetical protein
MQAATQYQADGATYFDASDGDLELQDGRRHLVEVVGRLKVEA